MSELAEFLRSRGGRLALKIAGVVVVLGLVVTAGWLWLHFVGPAAPATVQPTIVARS